MIKKAVLVGLCIVALALAGSCGEKDQTMDRKPTAAPAPAATIQPEIQQTMPPTAPEELTAPSSEAASGNQKEEKKSADAYEKT